MKMDEKGYKVSRGIFEVTPFSLDFSEIRKKRRRIPAPLTLESYHVKKLTSDSYVPSFIFQGAACFS